MRRNHDLPAPADLSRRSSPATQSARDRISKSIRLAALAASLLSLALFTTFWPAGAQQANDAAPASGGVLSILAEGAGPAVPSMHAAGRNGFHGGTYRDDAISALREFAQQIGGDQAEPIRAPHPVKNYGRIESDAYAELRAFVAQIGREQSAQDTPPIVVAAAEQPKAAKPAKAKTAIKAPVGDVEATIVGSQVCLTCHASQAAAFAQTVMGKIGKVRKGTMECENCHGPGSLHVKAGGGRGVGGMITFRSDDPTRTVEDNNAICLACHERGDRTLWRGSTHETQGLACTNCHTVMRNVTPKFQLAKLTEQDTCFQCHKNKRAEIWRTSHMPVREGKLTCSTCHNPHGSYSEALLKEGSHATANDLCYKCHAEKRGPFLWEHPPVRENCMNCHDAHGSINDAMLKISRPRLCQQCHANLTGHPGNPRNPTSVYAINRECQNCHSQHHGSNSPAGSRFIR
jgi:DmsE family decaheme c-type cytochrome